MNTICSPQGGLDGDNKDDLDSGDENEGRKIDTEEVMVTFLEVPNIRPNEYY